MNTYTTESAYTTYARDRGISIDVGSLASDLIISADFIDTYYTFKGQPVSDTQDMKLPTNEVAVPDIAKAALKAVELQQAGRLSLDVAALSGPLVESESKSLDGVGSVSKTYSAGSQVTFKPRVPELDLLLKPFIIGSMGIMKT